MRHVRKTVSTSNGNLKSIIHTLCKFRMKGVKNEICPFYTTGGCRLLLDNQKQNKTS